MTNAWTDFNDARQNSNLIPKGTIARVRLTIRPGGFSDPAQGWTGGYAKRGASGAVYLDVEYTMLEGQYAKRKIWSMIGLYSPKGPDWGNMGRSFVRGALNSSRGLSDKDNSPQAQNARRISGLADLDGTVEHAQNVANAFSAAGVSAALVHGEMRDADRKATLAAYNRGEIQVITNVAVLTEGWDHPPTSCVVLLRPSSYKSTMIQMVGRGLRTVNPEEYPGVVKTDCIILDFGTSSLIHGSLEQDVDIDGRLVTGDAPTKTCPACEAEVPAAVMECPLCGHVWESGIGGAGPQPLDQFVMTEIDLLARSSFEWIDVNGDGSAMMASGFTAWAGVFNEDGRFYAVGGAKNRPAVLLGVGENIVCLAAADDWLNNNETDESAHKTKAWLHQPATARQLAYLPPACRMDYSLTRYQASAMLSLKFNLHAIRSRIAEARGASLAAAA
jgi:hypothetical protein